MTLITPRADDLIVSDHRCWKCNYNLRGLSGLGRCPECGQAIDLSRLPVGRPWKTALALAASCWLLILLAGSIFLDVVAAATAFWQFVVIVTLLGAVAALPVWAITKRRGPAVMLAILIAVLLILPSVPTSPSKPFIRFYGRVRHGMSQAEVLQRLDARFPNRIANGHPSVVVQPGRITLVCDPNDWRYNAEVIWIDFKDDAVVGKRYSPD